jgi:uncharacterized Tic20 family protein
MTDPEPITPSIKERTLAAVSHAAILVSPGGFIVPAVIWLTQRNKSHYIGVQALQALAYQLCVFAAWFIGTSIYISLPFLGANLDFMMFTVMVIGGIVSICRFIITAYGVAGAIFAFQGRPFRYILIGIWVEHFIASIMNREPSWIYIRLGGIMITCLLILLAWYMAGLMLLASA